MVINPNSLGLDLPAGAVRVQPSFWYADEPAASDTWGRLLPAREAAGLQPLLLTEVQYLHPSQVADPDDHDPVAVLARLWEEVQEEDEDEPDASVAPFTRAWPGLAPPGEGDADPDAVAARVAAELAEGDEWLDGARGALVPARRSADIPGVLGWGGAAHHADALELSTVLRSWEERFGIRVVGLGPDLLTVSVAAPPRTMAGALAVAAEHYAFCPDNVWDGYDTIGAYAAEEVLDRHHWTFWWD
ncbi:DUF4253 domain-containing protein [Streptomyces sp. NPDC006368]|uniref:DUF4253 domain-containing protein n=1 Tax=Streptomyces sp. NPDC006368 TaxID=3156760 RepID=UPI00339EBCA6